MSGIIEHVERLESLTDSQLGLLPPEELWRELPVARSQNPITAAELPHPFPFLLRNDR